MSTGAFMILQCKINILSHPRSNVLVLTQPVLKFQEYLHSKNYIHGNVRARSVLVGRDLSVKLWGLGPAYHRHMSGGSIKEDMEMRKWQAPEVLGQQPLQQSSDMWVYFQSMFSQSMLSLHCIHFYLILHRWSFGILLYEMVTLGECACHSIRQKSLLLKEKATAAWL